ncbi:MAG: hypothetical protein ACFWUC_00780 [Oscillospiraceae bacterium]|jgi:TRAP-type C4-dicarboxylate transport system permease small subunit
MKAVLKYVDWILSKIENAVMITTILVMLVVLFAQVLMRYVFNSPLVWSEEVARYLFVYLTFIGISFGISKGTHIRMEFLINKFPVIVRKILDICISFFSAGIFVFLAPQCNSFLQTQTYVLSTATQIPMHLIYIALPIGLILAAIRLVMQGIAQIWDLKEKKAEMR